MIEIIVGSVLGVLVGSFINVVIYRLPIILEQRWGRESGKEVLTCTTHIDQPGAPFNLLVPRSHCPRCGHVLTWYENIPLASYLVLRGRCRVCSATIGARYPLVELLTGALFGFCFSTWGINPTGGVWCAFSAALVALAFIDWDTTLLPDDITLPLLWAGLIAAALGWTAVPLPDALWGAVAGYLSLWSIYWLFKLITGKEGMGYGDFKLFAALGVWFGWAGLMPIILMSSVIGAVVGLALKFSSGLREGGYVPFGPFLVGAAFTAMVFGPQAMLRAVGL